MNFSTTTTTTTTSTFTTTCNDLLSVPSEWAAPSEWADTDTQMIAGEDEGLLSATSFQAASKVLEQWISDGQHEPCHQQRNSHQGNNNSNIIPSYAVTPCDSSASSSASASSSSSSSSSSTTTTPVEQDDADLASLMEVDEQIGENLLGDELFGCGTGEQNDEHLHLDLGGGCGGSSCDSPTGPIEELTYYTYSATDSFSATNMIDNDIDIDIDIDIGMNEDDRRFLFPLLEDNSSTSTSTTMDYDVGYVVTEDEEQDQHSHSHSDSDSDSHSSQPEPIMSQERYQEILKKLEASMKRSQETRKSLTMKTPKTEEYSRSSSVTGVLSSIETSSRQLQTFLSAGIILKTI